MSTSLSVQSVSKSYFIYTSPFMRLLFWFGVPVKRSKLDILNNISFNVNKGEALALVGQNGAGKSTLLKIVARTLMATSGNVFTDGRVAAILELGMGFNPEFTGRENSYYVLSIMGLNRIQADDVIDKIQEFAEIGSYFEQPVRVYSSGMQMRLAFSIVTAVRPDILIIDEALSVGDSYFQHKSFAKIREFKQQGTTILFVSHDKSAILELCNRAILLQDGKVTMDGCAEAVMDYYNALIAQKENDVLIQSQDGNKVKTRSGSLELEIASVELQDEFGHKLKDIAVGKTAQVVIEIVARKKVANPVVGYLIKDRTGRDIFGTNTFFLGEQIELQPGQKKRLSFSSKMNLGKGSYSITVAIHSGPNHLQKNIDWQERAFVFEVHNTELIEFEGCNWLSPKYEVEDIE